MALESALGVEFAVLGQETYVEAALSQGLFDLVSESSFTETSMKSASFAVLFGVRLPGN